MAQSLKDRCLHLITDLGLAGAEEVGRVEPLTGGVASDIARVEIGDKSVCVKFALPKLKVAADWRAPVHRNAAEYAWLSAVGHVAPASVPRLYGRSEVEHGFVMEYLDGDDIVLWKKKLLQDTPDTQDAAAVGNVLGRIHAVGSQPGFDSEPFHNSDDFHDIRTEPYLLFTATRHPDLASPLTRMAEALDRADHVLVHGDISPKNILLRGRVPVFLDAECATMGDPCFDVAFCLNHLVLKAVHRPDHADVLIRSAEILWNAYLPHISWEDAEALNARVATLLPALMLARVDGKSPVEYLSTQEQDRVRALAIPAIQTPPESLAAFLATLKTETCR